MKKHRVVVACLCVLVVFLLQLSLLTVWHRTLGQAALHSAVWTGFMALWWFVPEGMRRRKERKLAAEGQFLAYIRYPQARPGSLESIWDQGILTPGLGSFQFQPALYDTLEPSGGARTFTVVEVSRELRELKRRDSAHIRVRDCLATTVTTDLEVIDLAAGAATLQKIIDQLAPPQQPVAF
ncbi:hypothetical protein ACFUCV_02175 [Specibacter sp. NPDC057265]|uniref:hypothetical protein n=1 Tax=Specibacter sp. NPDC057265 TaxID=3346075 RepID=UPI003634515A